MKKKWIVNRVTYSEIEIEAETYEDAEDIMSELDGDDDGWEYYNEEYGLKPEYNEHSMTHTVDRDDLEECKHLMNPETCISCEDDDVNEGKSLTVSTWISSLNDMDRILLNRIEALENKEITGKEK